MTRSVVFAKGLKGHASVESVLGGGVSCFKFASPEPSNFTPPRFVSGHQSIQ